MENIPLLKDIVILMAISVPMIIVLTRLGLPTIIGFLLAGVVIGPYGFALVTELESVEVLAQVGVVLLLFTIGLEFSVAKMLNLKREGILGGGLQVGITGLIVFVVGLYITSSFTVSLLLSFIISLSSTAIVLKLLLDRAEVDSPHGRLSVGVLLFQDICVVLMFMVIQSIGTGGGGVFEITKGVVFSFVAFAFIVVGVRYLIPRLFNQVVRLRNREVFILTILLVCMGTAWLTSLFGLSLAIGAFIAGLAISESEYSNQIVAEVIPFRDTFASLFFISIGMLLDLQFFITHVPLVLALVAAVIVLKTLVIIVAGQILKYPLRLSIAVGLTLAQIGEFSFILIKMGRDYTLLSEGYYQTLLAVSIISMAATPFLFSFSLKAAAGVAHVLGKVGVGAKGAGKKTGMSNHIIVVGYGLIGRNLARVLSQTAVPHLVMEINSDSVKEAKASGHKAHYGDASHPEILRKMGVETAKMLVVAISDPIATRRIVKNARDMNPALSILVRTRYTREVEELYKLGANQVIPEEFETSVEIFARVLRDYRIPGNIIQNQIDLIRDEGYAMLRNPSMTSADRLHRLTAVLEKSLTDTFYVDAGCSVAGKTLAGLDLRKKSGASVIAVVRKGTAKTNPGADFVIEESDILVVLGSHAELNRAMELLQDKCPA